MKLIASFTYCPGLLAEVKLFHFSHTNSNYYTQSILKTKAYTGLKSEGSYNNITKAKYYDVIDEDYAFARLSLVYAFGN